MKKFEPSTFWSKTQKHEEKGEKVPEIPYVSTQISLTMENRSSVSDLMDILDVCLPREYHVTSADIVLNLEPKRR